MCASCVSGIHKCQSGYVVSIRTARKQMSTAVYYRAVLSGLSISPNGQLAGTVVFRLDKAQTPSQSVRLPVETS